MSQMDTVKINHTPVQQAKKVLPGKDVFDKNCKSNLEGVTEKLTLVMKLGNSEMPGSADTTPKLEKDLQSPAKEKVMVNKDSPIYCYQPCASVTILEHEDEEIWNVPQDLSETALKRTDEIMLGYSD